MIILIWPLVIIATVVLYGLILVTLPFSIMAATFFLFTLIAFWSRLPGVGIPAPFLLLYLTDMIDLLGMIVAINMGGIYGVFLTMFCCIVGRACGAFTPWIVPIRESIALSICCLFAPFIYAATGDLFVCMMIFQTLRIVIIALMIFIGFAEEIPIFFARLVFGGTGLYIVNALYTKLFGDFFDNLLSAGVAFSWPLFFFATLVIFGSYGIMYFFSDKESSYNLKGIKKRIIEDWKSDKKHKKEKPKENPVKEVQQQAEPAETIKNGCPTCYSDVQGDNRKGFYCDKCNKIYRRRHLQLKRF